MTECLPTTARVFLVEDHPAVRHGLDLLLRRQGLTCCGEAEELESGLAGIRETAPDLVILDLSLGEEDGLALLRAARNDHPDLPFLIYSMYEDPGHVRRALQAGASGYVTKREPFAALAEAIQACLAGQTFLSPRLRETCEVSSPRSTALLSVQEYQVVELLGEGRPISQIAARLDLSPRTVETYFTRIITKLGLTGRQALREWAIQMKRAE